ncbi:MAG: LptF/LptG family permease [Verrucomicrobiales bacterium]
MRNYSFFSSTVSWLTRGHRVPALLVLAGILIAVDFLAIDVHRNFHREIMDLEIQPNESLAAEFLVPYFRQYWALACILSLPGFLLALYRNVHGSLVKPLAFASVALLGLYLPGELGINHIAMTQSTIGEEPSVAAFWGKVVLVTLLLLSPPLMAWLYARGSILNRYIVRSFLTPLVFCFFGFIAIWLIIDLSDNGPDFIEADTNLAEIGEFYFVQLPQVIILIMPISLLLSLLYSLSKMSKTNELVSMLGFGKSTTSILTPLFAVSLYLTFICITFNYHWAPRAEGHKESVLQKIKEGYEQKTAAVTQLYNNPIDHRSWFLGRIPFDLVHDKVRTVEIRQHDEEGRLTKAYFARSAFWFWAIKVWKLYEGVIFHYNSEGIPSRIEPFEGLNIEGWRETPWKLISSSFKPQHLGIPLLTAYINTNHDQAPIKLAPFRTHWHYRWALPFNCFVVTLVAAPLGIVYSRRGALGGVAAAIFIFFTMLFLDHTFLALGQGMYIPPFAAAWSTNFIFAGFGLILLALRSRNRNIPSFGLKTLARLFKSLTGRNRGQA